jgi:DnaD/phage-associated family protein
MAPFKGFSSGKIRLVPIPSTFFSDVLPEVDDVNTLKVMLYIFRALDAQDRDIRYLREKDLMADGELLACLKIPDDVKLNTLTAALEAIEKAGFLLKAPDQTGQDTAIFFLNSQKGRDALAALQSGKWHPDDTGSASYQIQPEWPGIYRLYEDNIGPLTPLLADLLQEAEKNYPPTVIQFAFEEAVKKNARNWKYIDAILRKWQEKGTNGQNSRDTEDYRRKYTGGEYAEFINRE